MAFGTIHETFWTSKTLKGISTPARLSAAYLLTGPHRNAIGCYRLPVSYIVEDLGWSADMVSDTLSELEERVFIQRDPESGLTLIPKFFEYNPVVSPKVGTMCARLADSLPKDSPVYGHLIDALKTIGDKLPPGWLDKQSYPIGYPIQRPEIGIPLNLSYPIQPITNQNTANGADAPAPPSRVRKDYSEDFEVFWRTYPPSKSAKWPAFLGWQKALKLTDAETLNAACKRYAEASAKPNAEFPCHASTWLNERRWEVWGTETATTGLTVIDATDAAARERKLHEDALQKLAKGFTWPQFLGPAPGESGCRIASDLLEKYRKNWDHFYIEPGLDRTDSVVSGHMTQG